MYAHNLLYGSVPHSQILNTLSEWAFLNWDRETK